MGYRETEYIWQDGQMKPWREATVHVLAHGLHYGSGVFEGLRAYETPGGTAIFRTLDHAKRLFESARLYDMPVPFDAKTIAMACRDVVTANGLSSAYIRPVAYRREGSFSLTPGADAPLSVAVAAIEWAAYLGDGAKRDGIDVCVSSWRRPSPDAAPLIAKACGHYLNAQLIAEEAKRNGFHEGIALDHKGYLSEGSSENLFLVRRGVLYTTPLSASILDGITRNTVITLARDAGIEVVETGMPREALLTAEEVFLTGTACEITPVRSVDRKRVADGKPGPITRAMQAAFFGLFSGETEDRWGWLDPVPTPDGAAVARGAS